MQKNVVPFRDTQIEVFDFQSNVESGINLPILFVPGWGVTPNSYEDTLDLICNSGRRIISFSYPTNVVSFSEKAEVVLAVLESIKIVKVDVIAHSEGCINAVFAADKKPELFHNFVLVASPGFINKESYLKIFSRIVANGLSKIYGRFSCSAIEKSRIKQWNNDSKKTVRAKGIIKSFFEGMNPGKIEIVDKVKKLHGVAVVVGQRDKMISAKKLQKIGVQGLCVDELRIVSGGHWDVGIKSEEYAPILIEVLGLLNNRNS